MEKMYEMSTPYIGTVSRSFTPGNAVKVYGVAPANACRFAVNLQCSAEINKLSDIALQILMNIQENNITVNSMRRGKWDKAEKIKGVLIKREERFVFSITCDFTNYKIFINNNYICEFPQKLTYDRVTHLAIYGDINLERISYEMEPTAPTFQTESLITRAAPAPIPEGPPPPYSEVTSKNYVPNQHNFMNYGACPLPMSSVTSPYPNTATFTPAIPGKKPYASQEMYTYSSGTEFPLNAASSNFRPVPASNHRKYLAYICCILFAVVIIIAGVLAKSSRNHHHHHHYRVDQDDDRDY